MNREATQNEIRIAERDALDKAIEAAEPSAKAYFLERSRK